MRIAKSIHPSVTEGVAPQSASRVDSNIIFRRAGAITRVLLRTRRPSNRIWLRRIIGIGCIGGIGGIGRSVPAPPRLRHPDAKNVVRVIAVSKRMADVVAILALLSDACGVGSPSAATGLPTLVDVVTLVRIVSKRKWLEAWLSIISFAHTISPVTEPDQPLRVLVEAIIMAIPVAIAMLRR